MYLPEVKHLLFPKIPSFYLIKANRTKYVPFREMRFFCLPNLKNIEFDVTDITNQLNAKQQLTLRTLLTDAALQYFQKDFGFELNCMSLLNMLFYQLLNHVPYHTISDAERSVSLKKNKRLKRILDYAEDHYTEKLLLTDIAKNEDLSLNYLSHLFKNSFSITFQQYVNKLRIEKAKQLIVNSNMKLIDICMECGFSDGKYMNRLFCQQYGCTPKEYRKTRSNTKLPESLDSNLIATQRFYTESESLTILKNYLPTSIFTSQQQ
jgi:YesN/AraC family two-component response regulator